MRSPAELDKHRQVIIRPVVSEKSTRLMEQEPKKYTFEVHRDANKTMIRQAIEAIYEVKVKKINTLNVRGKRRDFGRRYATGYTASWKKAIVTLQPGHELNIFEGT
ncbi:MAG: 50S ribosomal protein L23 [Armatimonadota bacterium]